MGRINKKRRSLIIKQNKKRYAKLAKLRKQYLEGKKDKELILEKALKISPQLTEAEFLKPIKSKENQF